jgi:hypothetical protein
MQNKGKAWITSKVFADILMQGWCCWEGGPTVCEQVCSPPTKHIIFKEWHFLFRPANCTSMLQPLDLGIINCMKAKYREALVQKPIAALERKLDLKLSVLQAIHLVMALWNFLNSDTIAHCFSKAGFGITIKNMSVDKNLMDKEDWQKVS